MIAQGRNWVEKSCIAVGVFAYLTNIKYICSLHYKGKWARKHFLLWEKENEKEYHYEIEKNNQKILYGTTNSKKMISNKKLLCFIFKSVIFQQIETFHLVVLFFKNAFIVEISVFYFSPGTSFYAVESAPYNLTIPVNSSPAHTVSLNKMEREGGL